MKFHTNLVKPAAHILRTDTDLPNLQSSTDKSGVRPVSRTAECAAAPPTGNLKFMRALFLETCAHPEYKAKKRFGQHFLKDTGVLDRIVRWIEPSAGQVFIEIGAGTGALSVRLAEKAEAFTAIELDGDCIPVLEEALDHFDSAAVVHADILSLDLAELASKYHPGKNLRVVGNLPYNIGTAIIEKLLHCGLSQESGYNIEAMFFMLQLEVAERILAQPETREYGFLSVLCQHHAKTRMGFKVSPACFAPRPKVMSAVISLHPKPSGKNAEWEADFEELVKAGFAYRRKTLANSLSRSVRFGGISPELLKKAGIDGARRAESLSVAEYEHLTDTLKATSENAKINACD